MGNKVVGSDDNPKFWGDRLFGAIHPSAAPPLHFCTLAGGAPWVLGHMRHQMPEANCLSLKIPGTADIVGAIVVVARAARSSTAPVPVRVARSNTTADRDRRGNELVGGLRVYQPPAQRGGIPPTIK